MPDRARLRELFDTKCVCTDEAELEICPRCLGLMSVVEQLPALLDALDEAEKERDAAQTAHGELFGTFTETEARLAEAEKALRKIERGPDCNCYPGMCPQGCEPACPKCNGRDDGSVERAIAREALARIGAGE